MRAVHVEFDEIAEEQDTNVADEIGEGQATEDPTVVDDGTAEDAEPQPTTETVTWCFGLVSCTKGLELVSDQISFAHRFRNKLIEIERWKRDAITQLRDAVPGLRDVVETIERYDKEMDETTARLAARKARRHLAKNDKTTDKTTAKTVATAERAEDEADRARVRYLSAELKERRSERKQLWNLAKAQPEVARALDEIQRETDQKEIEARHNSKCYWGNYLQVERDMGRSRRSIAPPQFIPWANGDGRVSVQIQGGMTAGQVIIDPGHKGACQLFQIAPEPHKGQLRRMRLRVGSDEKNKPIWAEWTMVLHRPFPPEARLKAAHVTREAIGVHPVLDEDGIYRPRWGWQLLVSLEFPIGFRANYRSAKSGVCALNLAWRMTPRGLRVGYVVGDDGYEEEILLPNGTGARSGSFDKRTGVRALSRTSYSMWERLEYGERLQSTRDLKQNDMQRALASWIKEQGENLPEWFRKRTEYLWQWKATRKFAWLAVDWEKSRFDGDETVYELIAEWQRQDRWLEQRMLLVTRAAHGYRKDLYRCAAAKLAERYATLVIDNTDLRVWQETPSPQSERVKLDPVARQQRIAAPTRLRDIFAHAFISAVELPIAKDTQRCSFCGHVEKRDVMVVTQVCSACRTSFDVDLNYGRNLLQRYHQSLAEGVVLEPPNVRKLRVSPWVAVRKKMAEKKRREVEGTE